MKYLFAILLFTSSNMIMAMECGIGKITKLYAGGWNSDDLVIQVDNSVKAPESNATMFAGNFVRYSATQNPGRIDFIRSMALAAYMAGQNVRTVSHNNDCANAGELVLGH